MFECITEAWKLIKDTNLALEISSTFGIPAKLHIVCYIPAREFILPPEKTKKISHYVFAIERHN